MEILVGISEMSSAIPQFRGIFEVGGGVVSKIELINLPCPFGAGTTTYENYSKD